MLLHELHNGNEEPYCSLFFDQDDKWLRAVWQGYILTHEAERGAQMYLYALRDLRVPYLLNDNRRVAGPWFDSTEWLEQVWAPQAAALGLRYVAHITPPDLFGSTTNASGRIPFTAKLELQVFDDMAAAEDWLRACAAVEAQTGNA